MICGTRCICEASPVIFIKISHFKKNNNKSTLVPRWQLESQAMPIDGIGKNMN